ncbi:MAG: thioredoxin domain-containing protein [Patescibacteria group bacterium]|nr:DsbA family protein [Patescibacteria group bacterium]
MSRKIASLVFVLLLTGCTGGASKESSRGPLGNPNGVITIMEFSDLECPACRMAHAGAVIPLMEQYGNVVRLEYKHFPLRTIHRFAMDSAESSECAADQGKFWEFIDLAYEHQADLGYDALLEWASQLQLDVPLFEKCWKSHSKRSIVLADYEEGRALGVNGTPSFFVNGEKVQPGFDTLSAAVEKVLKLFEQRL